MTRSEPGSTPQPKPARRWWLRMLVASAALVAVLLGAVWLTPVAKLHYHAWEFRKHLRAEDFNATVKVLRKRGASPEVVGRLLGKPRASDHMPDEAVIWLYDYWVVGVAGHDLLYFEDAQLREPDPRTLKRAYAKFGIRVLGPDDVKGFLYGFGVESPERGEGGEDD